jgi:phage gp45-like
MGSAADDRDRFGPYEGLVQIVTDMVRRGKVHLITDTAVRQRVQMEVAPPRFAGDEPRVESKIEYAQPYGFKSVPRAPSSAGAAEAVCLLVAGEPDHPLVVAITDVRDRPTGWAPGDVGLYDHRGNLVRCQAGKIEIEGATDIELGSGATKGVARINDTTVSDITTDPPPPILPATHWHGVGGWFSLVGIATAVGPPPPQLPSKIDSASATVKAKD